MSEYTHVEHSFAPVWDGQSRVLILGTLPSVKSREQNFYYGHPQNRFWRVISRLAGEPLPETIPKKKELLLKHRIAVWDVIRSCDIIGSSDSSIKNVEPADIGSLLKKVPGLSIYGNGEKACRLYEKYCMEKTGRPIQKLPSTSPANASWSLERLTDYWREALKL